MLYIKYYIKKIDEFDRKLENMHLTFEKDWERIKIKIRRNNN